MRPATLIDSTLFNLIINRLSYQLIENHDNFENTVLIGLQPRGVLLMNRLKQTLEEIMPGHEIQTGSLDITFFRDDFRRRERPISANRTDINFVLEDKNVILIDDVLYTGRSIRAGLDAMLSYGRPRSVELLVLIDRRFSRQLPVEPMYIGKSIDSYNNQRVEVRWKELEGEDKVVMFTSKNDE